jgi:hypothetical protein
LIIGHRLNAAVALDFAYRWPRGSIVQRFQFDAWKLTQREF